MTPEHAFLDSIWENLDDDDTKLIFADWLEERDDWRSSLLRWQFERNRHGFWTPEFKSHQGQIAAHLRQHGGGWLRPLSDHEVQYSDGTGLLWLTMTPTDLLQLPEPRSSEGVHRWVTEVSLSGRYIADLITALEKGPEVRLFLNFARSGTTTVARRLAEARGLERVRSLDLTYCGHARSDLEVLFNAPGLASLQYLFFGFCRGVEAALPALAQARHLTNLRGLDLARCSLRDPHLVDLARAPALEGLTALYLDDNHFGPEGIDALVASPRLKRLRILDLRKCGFGADSPIAEPLRQRFPFVTL